MQTLKSILSFGLCMQVAALAEAALIVPKDPSYQQSASAGQPESFESYQIRLLRNQNTLQAEKLKSLREDLAEATQKLQELKLQLFRPNDPQDLVKIADLTLRLGEKDALVSQLSDQKRSMETELEFAKRKLIELETIKEALTSLVEKHRFSNAQEAKQFKQEVEELKNSAYAEKLALTQKIQQHKSDLDDLTNKLESHSNTIKRLDAITTNQDEKLSFKNEKLLELEAYIMSLYDDILSLSDAYITQQHVKDEEIQKMTAWVDLERAQNEKLQAFKDSIVWLSDLYQGSQEILSNEIANLKQELETQKTINEDLSITKAELEARRQELSILAAAHIDYKSELGRYIKNLSDKLANEKSGKENKFLALLESHKNGIKYAFSLEGLLKDMDQLLSEKQKEYESAYQERAKTLSGLLLHLDHAEITLDHYQTAKDSLEKGLKELESTSTAKQELLQQKLDQATAEYQASEQNWQARLAKELSEQKGKELELHKTLEGVWDKYQSEEDRRVALEALLKDYEIKSQTLDEELSNHHKTIAENDLRIKELERKQNESEENFDTHKFKLNSEIEEELKLSLNLQSAFEDLSQKSESLTQQLNEHHKTIADKEKDIKSLQESFLAHKETSQLKTDQLYKALAEKEETLSHLQGQTDTIKSSLEQKAQELEKAHEDLKNHAEELALNLALKNNEIQALQVNTSATVEELQARVAELSSALSARVSQLQQYEDKYRALKDELQSQIHDLTASLQEKENLHLLALGKVTATNFDNQSLTQENEQILNKFAEIEKELNKEREKSGHQQLLVEKLKNELQLTDRSVPTLAALMESLQQLENSLAEREDELEAIRGHIESEGQEFLKKEKGYERAISQEKNRGAELQRELKLARQNFVQERGSLRNLEQIVEDSRASIEELELSLNEKDYKIQQLLSLSEKAQQEQQELASELLDRRLQELHLKEELENSKTALKEARQTIEDLKIIAEGPL